MTQSATYHRGSQNYGTGYEMMARIDELEAKLAKTMVVVEMIASADVDAVLGQAVDLSCEIIGELMEDGDDE